MVRLKHRYLLLNILYPALSTPTAKTESNRIPDVIEFYAPSPTKLRDRDLRQLILDGVGELFGDYGVGKISGSIKVIYFSTATSTAIVRVSRDHFRLVWTALSFVTKLPDPYNKPCVIHVVRNSGTIRLAEEEAIKRAREFVRRARMMGNADSGLESVMKTAVEKEDVAIELATEDEKPESMSEDEG